MGIEGTHLNIIKAIYEKPTTNILNGQKLKVFPLRSGTRQMSAFTTLIQHSIGSPSHSSQTRKRHKRHPSWEVPIFADDTIVYIENTMVTTKKLLDLISEYGKVAGYKVDIYKLMTVLLTNDDLWER